MVNLADLLITLRYHIIGLSHDIKKAKEVFTNNVAKKIGFIHWNYNNELTTLIDEKKSDELYNFTRYLSGHGMYDEQIELGNSNGVSW